MRRREARDQAELNKEMREIGQNRSIFAVGDSDSSSGVDSSSDEDEPAAPAHAPHAQQSAPRLTAVPKMQVVPLDPTTKQPLGTMPAPGEKGSGQIVIEPLTDSE
mmetsp:Transcript_40878/g.100554  ORF Transcript_40878/g.100554 Transcript_40878/m.100554 type:complete len:105 (-) Transcript_40878:74-388(-)